MAAITAFAVLLIFSAAQPMPTASCPVIAGQAATSARRIGPPPAKASAEELESCGDQLRDGKLFLDALDYYHAALSKLPKDDGIYNKAGITELLLGRYREARNDFRHAIKLNSRSANAHNNLGVIYYEQKNYGKAIHEYQKAIKLDPGPASYFVNLGAAYFSKKKWTEAAQAYSEAVQLDPNVFQQGSLAGASAQMSAPGDRARFDYLLAAIYAKNGMVNRALLCLRRAIESGYKNVNDAYTDPQFATLRKDPRFKELMSQRPVSIEE